MEIVFIFLLTLILTLLFVFALGSRGPWGSGWTVFLFFLLAIWAASIWIRPGLGPIYYDIAWVPVLIAGLIFFVLLLAVTPPRDRTTSYKEKEKEAVIAGGTMLFFWILLVIMAVLVALGYIL
ncbi:MAG: hypothetical protein R3345_11945 [Fulvivirga sp.]|nr:hypothetical protein [Fulvivirga sp.]